MHSDSEKAEFLDEMIKYWEDEKLLAPDQSSQLKKSYTIKNFDWQKLAQYSIYIALACGVFALGSLLIDKEMLSLLENLYQTPNIIISIISFAAAFYFLYLGNKRRKTQAKQIFSNEALLLGGILLIANGLAYFGKSISKNTDHYSLIFLAAVPVYAFLGYYFRSKLIWAFALFSFGAWFGTETSYISKGNLYFLGMNYPLRFVCFGFVLMLISWLISKNKKLEFLYQSTYFVAFLYTFTSLWLLSIFGNFASIDQWYGINQLTLLGWAALSIGICALTFFLGFKFKDEMAREFGATFLILNLYSRFFEYFWDSWHKALFFMILAISFWIIGRKAEKIWNLEFLKKE